MVKHPTPIVAVLYIIKHGYVLADGLRKDLPLAFAPQDDERQTLTFGIFERPNGDADLDDMELSIRQQMTEQGAKYSDIVLVAFSEMAEAKEALDQLEWEDKHLDSNSLWGRLCVKYKVRSLTPLEAPTFQINAKNADEIEKVWHIFLAALQHHDFTYNTQELGEDDWTQHNKMERQMRNCRCYLHDIGKGELADKYYDKFSERCTNARFLPVDELPHLIGEVERYKRLLTEHDFTYQERVSGISHHLQCEKRAHEIFLIRRFLHTMGIGELADRIYWQHAPERIEPIDPELWRA